MWKLVKGIRQTAIAPYWIVCDRQKEQETLRATFRSPCDTT